jgi:uncharacterized membrane protein YccC
MTLLDKLKLSKENRITALHYAIRIFIGAVIVEFGMSYIGVNPIWAMVSLITVTEPQIKTAWTVFSARFLNTLIGCLTGVCFLLAVAVLIGALLSITFTNMQQGWRIGPVTVAIIMSAGITEKSIHDALEVALQRTGAVLGGSVVALLVTWCVSYVWMPPEVKAK